MYTFVVEYTFLTLWPRSTDFGSFKFVPHSLLVSKHLQAKATSWHTMRLIDSNTLELHDFSEEQIPYGQFAVISHRWTKDEVTFKEYRRGLKKDSIGYKKILSSCELAKSRNRQYVWIDTCCIDKRSSAELSEDQLYVSLVSTFSRMLCSAPRCVPRISPIRSRSS